MNKLIEKLAFYRLHHRNTWNRVIHFIAIPTIIFSVLVSLALIRFRVYSLEISLAMVFVCVVLAYYFLLDVSVAAGTLILNAPLLFLAEYVARNCDVTTAVALFVITAISAGALQIVGHLIEGKRPAFIDNLFQVFIAPIFLVVELLFVLRLRKDLQVKLERLESRRIEEG